MKIVVLGGAGAMAQVIVRDLLETSEADVIGVADVNFEAASHVVSLLGNSKASGS